MGSDGKVKTLDQFFGVLLLVGSGLHAYESISSYRLGSTELVWALSGLWLAGWISVVNLVRAGRPKDTTVAWISLVASICWAIVAVGFGAAAMAGREGGDRPHHELNSPSREAVSCS
jgi:hypothetical protein